MLMTLSSVVLKRRKVRIPLHLIITIILGHGALSQARTDVTGKMPLIHVVSLVVVVDFIAIVAVLSDGTRLDVQARYIFGKPASTNLPTSPQCLHKDR